MRWDTEAEQSYGLNEMAQYELQSAWGGVRMCWEKLHAPWGMAVLYNVVHSINWKRSAVFLREKWISQDSSTIPHPNPLSVSPPTPLTRTNDHAPPREWEETLLAAVDQIGRFKTVMADSAYKPKWILRKKDLVVWWLEEAYFINKNLQCVASHFNTYSLKLVSFCDSYFSYLLS